MNKLINSYKTVTIPKNTIIYRKFKDNSIYDNMYFGFDNYNSIYASGYPNEILQKWIVIKDITSKLIVNSF